MNAPVFVSHSSKDEKVARTICSALESRGVRCWVASRDISPGDNFMEAIVRTIRSAKMMVLIFSDNANNSEEIKKEVVLATQHRLAIIPVRIEDVIPNDALAYQFATMQWIDVFEDWENDINRLCTYITSLQVSAEAVVVPAPPAAAPTTHVDDFKTNLGRGIYILPFWKTVLYSYRNALGEAAIFLRLSWQWFLVTIAIDLAASWVIRSALQGGQKDSAAEFFINFFFASLFGLFIAIFVASVVGDRYLRLKLLKSAPETGLKLHASTLSYFGSFIKIFLLCYVPCAVIVLVLMVSPVDTKLPAAQQLILDIIALVALAALVAALFVSCRLFLILPFKALGHETVTLGDVWRQTRHNNMSILLATIACWLPSWIVTAGTALAQLTDSVVTDLSTEAVDAAVSWICSWVFASFLLAGYRHLFASPEAGH